jgi:ferritin-like protein
MHRALTYPDAAMGTPWDARAYDRSSAPQRAWASEVLEERPTLPQDVDAFVRTSILPAHLARLPEQRQERFAAAVVAERCACRSTTCA